MESALLEVSVCAEVIKKWSGRLDYGEVGSRMER